MLSIAVRIVIMTTPPYPRFYWLFGARGPVPEGAGRTLLPKTRPYRQVQLPLKRQRQRFYAYETTME